MFYVHDGHGSVRALANTTGAVTDTYDYDAFGNVIHSTGTTPNNYLFAGEQFDPDLHLYYHRARYLNVTTGRFWTMDTFEGDNSSPPSLHKYLYASNDPIDRIDPAGNQDLLSEAVADAVYITIAANTAISILAFGFAVNSARPPDAFIGSVRVTLSGTPYALTGGAGFDIYVNLHTFQVYIGSTIELGISPIGLYKIGKGFGGSATGGFVFGSTGPSDLLGLSFSAVWPIQAFTTLTGVFRGQKEPFATLGYIARLTRQGRWTNGAAILGFSASTASYFEFGPRSNAFASLASYTLGYQTVPDFLRGLANGGRSLLEFVTGLADEARSVTGPEALLSFLDKFNP